MLSLKRVPNRCTPSLDGGHAPRLRRGAHALAQWERHAIERLLASPAMHVMRPRCAWTGKITGFMSTPPATVKCTPLRPSASSRHGGVAVHDCWASYLSYAHCDHALCGAHLLRELAFIVDAHGYAWARRMKRLLLGACHQVSKRDDKTLARTSTRRCRNATPSSPKGRESFHPSHLAKTASAAKWPSPMPIICGSG